MNMNVRINRRFSSCTNNSWLVFIFIIGAIVIAFSGCRHAPVFSDDSKIDVRFTGADPGYRMIMNFERDFERRKYFWVREPEGQVVLMDLIRKHVNPAKKDKFVKT